jgi:hypothetical protein
MATWKADVFVNSQVGRITTEVQASTFSGAKEQIYAKHGNVQQITNLHQVSNNSSSSSSGSDSSSVGGTVALIGLIAVGWVFVSFTPWILMGLGGAAGTWIGEKVTGQSIEDYNERDDDFGHGKVGIVLALALVLGGLGFVKGDELKKGFDAPSDTPAQVQPASK